MNDSKISVRYSRALFSLAQEKSLVDEVAEDIAALKNIWDHVLEFRILLESPIITTSQKKAVVRKAFFASINPVTQSFLDLVLQNKREMYLAGIARVFMDSYKKYKRITSAVITTTQPINNEARDEIVQIIKNSYTSSVELNEIIKPEIIGGFVLRIDDHQLDASVSTQLKNIRKELLNTTVKS